MKGKLAAFMGVVLALGIGLPNAMADPGTAGDAQQGTVSIQRTGVAYPTLGAAADAAQDGDTLVVNGEVGCASDASFRKSVTLVAAQGGGTLKNLHPKHAYLNVTDGGSLTLGSGDSSHTLDIKNVGVKVTQGSFAFKDGAHIFFENSSISAMVEVAGNQSKASFYGGTIDCLDVISGAPDWAVKVTMGASVDEISGGQYRALYGGFSVGGKGTVVKQVRGGTFANNVESRQSQPAFLLEHNARIDEVSGGQFKAARFGGLQLESGASVGLVSGGVFEGNSEPVVSESSGAAAYCSGLVLYARNSSDPVVVEKITGGTFSGYNAMLLVGASGVAKVNEITGGSFKGITDTGIRNCGNAEIGSISNASVEGASCGIYNLGTINHIKSGTFKGVSSDGLFNENDESSLPAWIGKMGDITGGTFEGAKRGLYNSGSIDKIAGGVFVGKTAAVSCSSTSKKGNLDSIESGVFYSEGSNCIELVLPLAIEPGLTASHPSQGTGRYYVAESGTIFNDDSLVTFPRYSHPKAGQEEYFMSSSSDTLESSAKPGVAFRYLRQLLTVGYNLNLDDDKNSMMEGSYLKPGQSATLWDAEAIKGKVPENLKLTGWSTSPDGKGTSYEPGAEVKDIVSDLKLYAQFQKVEPDKPAPAPSQSEDAAVHVMPSTPIKAVMPVTGDDCSVAVMAILAALSISGAALAFRLRESA